MHELRTFSNVFSLKLSGNKCSFMILPTSQFLLKCKTIPFSLPTGDSTDERVDLRVFAIFSSIRLAKKKKSKPSDSLERKNQTGRERAVEWNGIVLLHRITTFFSTLTVNYFEREKTIFTEIELAHLICSHHGT